MYYKASLDKMAIGVSIGIIMLFIAISIMLPLSLTVVSSGIPGMFASVLFLLLILFVWLYHSAGYELTTGRIRIKRLLNTVSISRSDIQSIRPLEKAEIRGTIRTFGVGGFFGYFGKFYNARIGKMTWYVSNMNNLLLITMKDGKMVVISPDDRNAFIKESGN